TVAAFWVNPPTVRSKRNQGRNEPIRASAPPSTMSAIATTVGPGLWRGRGSHVWLLINELQPLQIAVDRSVGRFVKRRLELLGDGPPSARADGPVIELAD